MATEMRRVELNDVPYMRKGDGLVFSMNDAPPVVACMSDARRHLASQGYAEGQPYRVKSVATALKPGEGSLSGFYINEHVPFEFFLVPAGLEAIIAQRKQEHPVDELHVGMRPPMPYLNLV